jgi:hypothetical protein
MILSHQNKFIFIHIYKVAGASIKMVFDQYDDRTRSDFSSLNNFKFFLGKKFNRVAYLAIDHLKASEIKTKINSDIFNSYFKFCFVRNPWDWQVSLYHFMLQDKDHWQHRIVNKMKSFEDYIEWRIDGNYELQKDFVYDENGNMLVNFVGKFENLQTDFAIICDKINIPRVNLPHVNTSKHAYYKDYYNENTKDLIYKTFKEDITLFNYEF